MNLSQSDYRFSKPLVYDKLGFLPRRDGIGSFWFSNEERAMVHDELFPKRALIGEGCWWFNAQDGDNSKYKHSKMTKRFAMNDFKVSFYRFCDCMLWTAIVTRWICVYLYSVNSG